MLKRFSTYYICTLIFIILSVFFADRLYQKKSEHTQISLLFELIEVICRKSNCNQENKLSERITVFPYSSLGFTAKKANIESNYTIINTSEQNKSWMYVITPDKTRVFRVYVDKENNESLLYTTFFYVVLSIALLAITLPFFVAFYHIKRSSELFAATRDHTIWRNKKSLLFQSVFDALSYMSYKFAHAIALQRELSNTLSHEARTIISRIKLSLNCLNIPESDSNLFKQDLKELEVLSDEFLRLSKSESEVAPKKVEINIFTLIHSLAIPYQKFSKKNISIRCATNFSIYSDESLLNWTLRNLLDNGVKYANSNVLIIVDTTKEGWFFSIQDDGPGIDFNNIEELFLPFSRPDDSCKSGYGYGLAIATKAAELLKGTITVKQAIDLKGSCFIVDFKDN